MFRHTVRLAASISACLVLLCAHRADAAEILVTTVSDAIIDGDFRCTLREAIAAANADAPLHDCDAGDGADTILLFFESDHVLSVAGANEDGNLTGDLDITDDLTIRPAGDTAVTIDADGLDRVFNVHGGANLTLENLRVQGGSVVGFGGGIFTLESTSLLTLRSSVVTGNDSTLFGGGISSEGTVLIAESFVAGNQSSFGGGVHMTSDRPLTVLRSEISGNRATADGGGVNASRVQILESSIYGNTAERDGGGLYLADEAVNPLSVLSNSTVAYNESWRDGGGLFVAHTGIARLFNVTVAYNAADSDIDQVGDGGGLFVADGTFEPQHSIFGANLDLSTTGNQAPDCFGAVSSEGHNLFSAVDFADCVITGQTTTDLNGSIGGALDPDLDPCLQAPGESFTSVLLPLPTSVVIDAGDESGCLASNGDALLVDQAGNRRPWDGPDVDDIAVCDIGAIEFGSVPFTLVFADGFESGDTMAWSMVSPRLPGLPLETRQRPTVRRPWWFADPSRVLRGCD